MRSFLSSSIRPFRRMAPLCLVCLALLGTPQHAWAQRNKAEPEPVKKEAWVISYALLILCVGGGLFTVLKPGKRDRGRA